LNPARKVITRFLVAPHDFAMTTAKGVIVTAPNASTQDRLQPVT
jgi:hypothetical protein